MLFGYSTNDLFYSGQQSHFFYLRNIPGAFFWWLCIMMKTIQQMIKLAKPVIKYRKPVFYPIWKTLIESCDITTEAYKLTPRQF
jgi:hypothetical protein